MKNYIIILIFISVIAGCGGQKNPEKDSGINLSKAMGKVKDEKFEKAYDKRKFIFPEDHGPHPGFRTEWWYFTGNLTTPDNKKFGYQFTVFRTALSSGRKSGVSEWRSDQIYMAHFTVTDISNGRFYFDERFSRDGNELAGAQAEPLKVWLEDWQITESENRKAFDLPVISIKAKSDKTEIRLWLESVKPLILQGNEGLSQKGSQPGNASYYYSYTNLKTSGIIITEDREYEVNGKSWMDREWSTSALSEDQKGWDWFSLQLDDSTELMYYQMRKKDGTPDKYSSGVIIDKAGLKRQINREEADLEVTESRKNSSGIEYPSGWNLKIPSEKIELKIIPAVRDQFLDVTVKYWEGSVTVKGKKNNTDISGRGYAELTGY
ncbi:MAG: carotenoid 1,2-hydratase [Ignavibacteria bacterium]|nr:carotenoid 1,2-hydratase [Ignavibacteria bacterium]